MKKKHALFGVGALALVGSLGLWRTTATKCPFERTASANEIENGRQATAAKMRQGEKAKARPASGLVLDTSTKADVRAWAEKAGLACHDELNGSAMRCEGKAELSDVFARFEPKGTLVGLDIVHAATSPERAASAIVTLATSVESAAGPATSKRGQPTAEGLGGGRLSHAAFEFRFADYAADVSATSFVTDDEPKNGIIVREQYRAL